ncbi:sensor histidine kinase [Metaclostridioides mangenotii]|uniref:sensor histidine kinase n=1 Tax=Metaclostridioides mangenotii TaxID=1540 RepID=UPI0026EC6F45|nr:HAMP domain-containing sensor histidine kinase [Clostridioides mangenotii]
MENNNEFNRIYIGFFSAFFIVSSIFIVFIININKFEFDLIKQISLFYVVLVLIIVAGLLYKLRKAFLEVINNLENIVEDTINEKLVIDTYEDTILSSLEYKLYKYIKVSQNNKLEIENERNKINALVADISHQTKTPISNLVLFSQLILENKDLDEYSRDILKDINLQSERLNFLIQSLIKMSRLESGVILPSKSETKIIDTITVAVQEIYPIAEIKNIDIHIEGDRKITANYDGKWTKEAVVNILENAIKYSKEDQSIKINLVSHELFNRIDIEDSGIGINETELNSVFRRFYRCKNSNQQEGIGIGLYLAREIIAVQGGFIKVTSKVNEGSIFSVFLPT